MDINVLKEYIDACELVKDTEQDIARLRKDNNVIQSSVKASSDTHPYTELRVKVSGVSYTNEDNIRQEEIILEQRIKDAAQIKIRVQEYINTMPIRIQRIVRYRYFEGYTWNQVADKMGRGATEDSIRKECKRYFEKNETLSDMSDMSVMDVLD